MAKRPTTDTHEISPGFAWAGVRASGASGLESEPVNPLVSFRCVLLNRYLLEPAELEIHDPECYPVHASQRCARNLGL